MHIWTTSRKNYSINSISWFRFIASLLQLIWYSSHTSHIVYHNILKKRWNWYFYAKNWNQTNNITSSVTCKGRSNWIHICSANFWKKLQERTRLLISSYNKRHLPSILASSFAPLVLQASKKSRKWHRTTSLFVITTGVFGSWLALLFLCFSRLGLWSFQFSLVFTAWRIWRWTGGARIIRSPPGMLQGNARSGFVSVLYSKGMRYS